MCGVQSACFIDRIPASCYHLSDRFNGVEEGRLIKIEGLRFECYVLKGMETIHHRVVDKWGCHFPAGNYFTLY